MHDFIGQPIVASSWVAVGGKGNTAAEYGMILHRVNAVKDGKLNTQRLKVTYNREPMVSLRATTISKGTKVVVVRPSLAIVSLFDRVANGTQTRADFTIAGKWVHGQTEGLFT